ncbi:uncharacterized protein LOC106670314 [Cimex lectularius]|uniref:Uncharacterized protein n=1 Tax=Cimex lectularius TaxID=79782 RepID=A0A8I6S582_CIMLE|nr:uncharacterized protein LOC106670314 [Cimex lectularius]
MLACFVLLLMVKDAFTRDNQSFRKMEQRFGRELIIADGIKSAVDLVMSRMKTLKEETALEMENHAEDMRAIMRNFQEVADFQVCSPNRTERVYSEICNCVENRPAFPDYNNETFSLGQSKFRQWSQNYDSLSSDVNKTRDHIKMMQIEFRKSEKVCKNIVDLVRKEECTWEINKRANKTFEDIKSVQDKASKIILEVKEVLEKFVDEIFQHKTSQMNDLMAKIESYACCFDRIGLRVQNHECEKGNSTHFLKYTRTLAGELEEMKIFLKHDYNATRVLLDNMYKTDSDDENDHFDSEARQKFVTSASDHLPRHKKKYYGIELKGRDSWPSRSVFTEEQNDQLLIATNVKKRDTEFIEKSSENEMESTTEAPTSQPKLNMSRDVETNNANNIQGNLASLKEKETENSKLKNTTHFGEITTIKFDNMLSTSLPQLQTTNHENSPLSQTTSNVHEDVTLSQETENPVTMLKNTASHPSTEEMTTLKNTNGMQKLQPQLNDSENVNLTNGIHKSKNFSIDVTNSYTMEETSTLQDLIMSTLYPQFQDSTTDLEGTAHETSKANSNESTEFKNTSFDMTTNLPMTETLEYNANKTESF